MSAQTVDLQSAFVLQHRPYRESSVLLEVFTRDFGIVSMLAKGVRKEKSKMAGLLLPFTQLNVSYLDRHELKVLGHAEFVASYPLQRLALYCGFYVNELLQKFLHRNDPHQELFEGYLACLHGLSNTHLIEQTLRYFELSVLQESGYGVELDLDSRTGAPVQGRCRYSFLPDSGLIEDANGKVSGATLQLLAARALLDHESLNEAKWLLRAMLEVHLRGRPLKSRDVLSNIVKHL